MSLSKIKEKQKMNIKTIENFARMFEVLGSKVRLEILKITTHEEKCVNLISKNLKLSQPTVSYHLRLLLNIGLVKRDKTAQWVRYSLNKEKLSKLLNNFFRAYGILNIQKEGNSSF